MLTKNQEIENTENSSELIEAVKEEAEERTGED